jgi:hypothetical protein
MTDVKGADPPAQSRPSGGGETESGPPRASISGAGVTGPLNVGRVPSRPGGHRHFWLSAAIGWSIIGYGLWGIVHHHVDTRPRELARYVIGVALTHDLIIAPLVIAVGVAVKRLVKGPARAVVQAALILSVVPALFAYPEVRRFADANHNPSSLPRNYTMNLGILVAAIWFVAALVVVGLHLGKGRQIAPEPVAEPLPPPSDL